MDFHCHVDLYSEAQTVFEEAARRNEFTWLVTTSPRAFAATSRRLGAVSNVLVTPGLHPEIAADRASELDLLLEQMSSCKAVGEVGLDGAPRYRAGYSVQRDIFSAVVGRCAALGGRVLSIHSRQAAKDVLQTLDEHPGYGVAVLHWFTGTGAELRAAIEAKCWFSIGPAAFNSAAGKALAARLPKERTVPESDGPFAKLEGSPVMPWSMDITATLLARAWAMPPGQAHQTLVENSRMLRALIDAQPLVPAG